MLSFFVYGECYKISTIAFTVATTKYLFLNLIYKILKRRCNNNVYFSNTQQLIIKRLFLIVRNYRLNLIFPALVLPVVLTFFRLDHLRLSYASPPQLFNKFDPVNYDLIRTCMPDYFILFLFFHFYRELHILLFLSAELLLPSSARHSFLQLRQNLSPFRKA